MSTLKRNIDSIEEVGPNKRRKTEHQGNAKADQPNVFEIKELVEKILSYLLNRPKILIILYSTNKRLRAVMSSKSTWMNLGYLTFAEAFTAAEIPTAKMTGFFAALILKSDQEKIYKLRKRNKILVDKCNQLIPLHSSVENFAPQLAVNRTVHTEACTALLGIIQGMELLCVSLQEFIEFVSLKAPISRSEWEQMNFVDEYWDRRVAYYPMNLAGDSRQYYKLLRVDQVDSDFDVSLWITFFPQNKSLLLSSDKYWKLDNVFVKMDHNKNCIEICGSLQSLAETEFESDLVSAFAFLEESTKEEADQNMEDLNINTIDSKSRNDFVSRNIPFKR